MADTDASFADALERLRGERGLSPAQLARALNEYEGNVSRWRHGGGIDQLNVWKVADFFGVERASLERLAGYGAVADDRERERNPRLAAFIAQVEAAFRALTAEEWQVREQAARALFAIPVAQQPTNGRRDPSDNGRPVVPVEMQPARRYRGQKQPKGPANKAFVLGHHLLHRRVERRVAAS